jgi:hypothetical protein
MNSLYVLAAASRSPSSTLSYGDEPATWLCAFVSKAAALHVTAKTLQSSRAYTSVVNTPPAYSSLLHTHHFCLSTLQSMQHGPYWREGGRYRHTTYDNSKKCIWINADINVTLNSLDMSRGNLYLVIQYPAGASPHLALGVCRPFGSMDPPVTGRFSALAGQRPEGCSSQKT